MIIPPEELDFQAIRAQGSGGQNVNKSLVVVCR
jgi:protein subunit release factor B